jgi:hypothetical protein
MGSFRRFVDPEAIGWMCLLDAAFVAPHHLHLVSFRFGLLLVVCTLCLCLPTTGSFLFAGWFFLADACVGLQVDLFAFCVCVCVCVCVCCRC